MPYGIDYLTKRMSTEAADGQIVNHVSYIVCGMSKEDWEMVNPAVFRVGDLKKKPNKVNLTDPKGVELRPVDYGRKRG